VTMFAGNLGAVIAGAPLAWVVTQTSWRTVFVVLGALSALLAIATWLRVRDRPELLGFAPVNPAPAAPAAGGIRWREALGSVLRNPATWPPFVVNMGVGGSYLAFAGLWAVPYLQQVHEMPRVMAAQHASALLLGVALGSVGIGVLSDRLRSRVGVMRAAVLLYVLSWLPWLLHLQWPLAATLAWFLLMGLLIPGFTLSWTIAKEANPPQYSGIATAVVNTGIFLGAGILQPLVGWVLDRGAGDATRAWDAALWVLAGAAVTAFAATWMTAGRPTPAQR